MAYGDQNITYPMTSGPYGSGRTGNHAMYTQTVVSGPARVGDRGTFVFRFEYAGVDRDPNDLSGYVDYDIAPSFYFATEYEDYYNSSGIQRIYLYGSVSPEAPVITRTFSVGSGWLYVEFASGGAQMFGHSSDPTPYGVMDGNTMRLWNGSTFTITADGPTFEPTDYKQVTATGVGGFNYTVSGRGTRFGMSWANAKEEFLHGDRDIPVYTLDLVEASNQAGIDFANPPTPISAPYPPSRIWRVSVQGSEDRRRGSFTGEWFFGRRPLPPEPETGGTGGGLAVNHGTATIATGTTTGDLRTSQSPIGQRFVRAGMATALTSRNPTAGSAAPSSEVRDE